MKETIKEMDLNMDELEQVNGRGFCMIVGIGLDAAACAGKGSHVESDYYMEGLGTYACYIVGVGAGYTVEH